MSKRGYHRWTAEKDAVMQAHYRGRESLCDVAQRLGHTVAAVYDRARKLGLTRSRGAISESHYTALVAEEARRLSLNPLLVDSHRRRQSLVLARRRVWRRLRNEGYSLAAIAKAAECSHTAVYYSLRRLAEVESDITADNPVIAIRADWAILDRRVAFNHRGMGA